MDPFNHLAHLINKSKYNTIIPVPVQSSKGNACTHIAFAAIRRGKELIHNYFNDESKFQQVYTSIIKDGENNRK